MTPKQGQAALSGQAKEDEDAFIMLTTVRFVNGYIAGCDHCYVTEKKG